MRAIAVNEMIKIMYYMGMNDMTNIHPSTAEQFLNRLHMPVSDSHKGQNGKLLLIGGSQLFHAASKWSLDIASRCVDMVFYASIPSNNQLIQEAKGSFWNGIVIERTEIENYIAEADVVLIGPGMTRNELTKPPTRLTDNTEWSMDTARNYWSSVPPNDDEWNSKTEKVVNYLVSKYSDKKWVIDAGALQMIDPALITQSMILTPHLSELRRLLDNSISLNRYQLATNVEQLVTQLVEISKQLQSCCIVFKGPVDIVVQGDRVILNQGGNPGMTKGGTGDVLSGLIAGLAATNDTLTSAVVGSYVNKKAGELLATRVGPFFNASDLVQAIPQVLWESVS